MNRKVSLTAAVMLLMVLLLCACSDSTEETETGYYMYYINNEETKVVKQIYYPDVSTSDHLLQEFLTKLQNESGGVEYRKALPDNVKLLGSSLQNGQLFLDFSKEYLEMSPVAEVLCRAAIVKTLTQVETVEYVSMSVNGEPLTDTHDNPIGNMSADNFVENSGEEVNTYMDALLVLYFANEDGDKLVRTTFDNVHYSSNMSLEKVVIEKLIEGPAEGSGVYPMLPADTKLLTISKKDGVCYVNFDSTFLNAEYDVKEELPVYAVVNSLIDSCNVNKVQIAIDGETNTSYREVIQFDSLLERNAKIIEEEQEEKD